MKFVTGVRRQSENIEEYPAGEKVGPATVTPQLIMVFNAQACEQFIGDLFFCFVLRFFFQGYDACKKNDDDRVLSVGYQIQAGLIHLHDFFVCGVICLYC
jgi:hypothetical protein